MMKRNVNEFRSALGFEGLEGRRLMAADLACGAVLPIETGATEQCEIASIEASSDVVDDVVSSDETMNADPRNLDLTDGMDGYFGELNPDSPNETLSFTAPADGTVNVVLASTLAMTGQGSMELTLSTADGTGIEMVSASTEKIAGFDSYSFEVGEGERYELTLSHAEGDTDCQTNFQTTVGFEQFVDQHADEIGEDSTHLEWTDGAVELVGKLESAGDVDTFFAKAPADGEVTLKLNELVEDDRIDLDVRVTDADGNLIADGATNETLQISFDVSESQAFFISISAGDNQKGDYQFVMTHECEIADDTDSKPADEVVDVVDEGTAEAADTEGDVDEATDVADAADEPVGSEGDPEGGDSEVVSNPVDEVTPPAEESEAVKVDADDCPPEIDDVVPVDAEDEGELVSDAGNQPIEPVAPAEPVVDLTEPAEPVDPVDPAILLPTITLPEADPQPESESESPSDCLSEPDVDQVIDESPVIADEPTAVDKFADALDAFFAEMGDDAEGFFFHRGPWHGHQIGADLATLFDDLH